MARVIFWDVDTQYDFMTADGKLYVPEAEQILGNLKRLTGYAHGHAIRIVASADDHGAADPEISERPDWKTTFPPHCMRGTPGQKKVPETALKDPLVIEPDKADRAALAARVRAHRGDILFHKHRFDVFSNENVMTVLGRLPHTRLFVVTDAVKGIDKDASEQLLKEWGDEGVRLIKTKEVVEEGLVEDLARAPA